MFYWEVFYFESRRLVSSQLKKSINIGEFMSQDMLMVVLVLAMIPFSLLLKKVLTKVDRDNQEIENNSKK
jgi:hypothetical protein